MMYKAAKILSYISYIVAPSVVPMTFCFQNTPVGGSDVPLHYLLKCAATCIIFDMQNKQGHVIIPRHIHQ